MGKLTTEQNQRVQHFYQSGYAMLSFLAAKLTEVNDSRSTLKNCDMNQSTVNLYQQSARELRYCADSLEHLNSMDFINTWHDIKPIMESITKSFATAYLLMGLRYTPSYSFREIKIPVVMNSDNINRE